MNNRGRRGLALVETALVLPLVMLLVLGLLEYGWMFLISHRVAHATREGARVGARAIASRADLDAAVLAVLQTYGLDDEGHVINVTPSDPAALEAGQLFTVQVSIPYDQIALIGIPMLPAPETIRATVAMARE